jgi:predicted transcriptional regulator
MIRQGVAKRYDIYRRAGNESQTDRVIKYLEENGLMEGDDDSGYRLTKKGEDLHGVLKRRDLLSLLTRDLSRDKMNRW